MCKNCWPTLYSASRRAGLPEAFPINETIKTNVLDVVSRALDFFTFEVRLATRGLQLRFRVLSEAFRFLQDYQIHSPPPFQESSVDLRAQLARIRATTYPVGACGLICGAINTL